MISRSALKRRPLSANGEMSRSSAPRCSPKSLLKIERFVLKYQSPVFPVISGLRGPGLYRCPLRQARVGCCLRTFEISSGSSASPAKRRVANVPSVFSGFIINVAERFAVLIRDRPIIIYDNAIRATEIAPSLNFMECGSEFVARNSKQIADILRRVLRPVPDYLGH